MSEPMINNRKISAWKFYYRKPIELRCLRCESIANLYEINDGFDSVICFDCLSLSLEDLSFSDDYESDQFNREKVPRKRFGKEWE